MEAAAGLARECGARVAICFMHRHTERHHEVELTTQSASGQKLIACKGKETTAKPGDTGTVGNFEHITITFQPSPINQVTDPWGN